MTRKDFNLLAATICQTRQMSGDSDAILDLLAENLAVKLAAGNEFFDTGRFLHACGVSTS